MRIALLIVAGIALIGFLAVAVVLPHKAGADAREAAQALISGAEPAQKQVAALAEKTGNLAGVGKGHQARGEERSQARRAQVDRVRERRHPRLEREERDRSHHDARRCNRGKANWNCKGYPVTVMPASCGGIRSLTAVRIPCMIAAGGGGQPGTATSTGITLATRPRLA